MIRYKLGDVELNFDFESLLVVFTKNRTLYKSDFEGVSDFFEYLHKNINDIIEITFDSKCYRLKNGLLHNLWSPALSEYNQDGYFKGWKKLFYIDGKLVYCKGEPIKSSEKLLSDIYHHEEITQKKTGKEPDGTIYRRKEGVDYKHHYIDIEKLRKKEMRQKKLEEIENEER